MRKSYSNPRCPHLFLGISEDPLKRKSTEILIFPMFGRHFRWHTLQEKYSHPHFPHVFLAVQRTHFRVDTQLYRATYVSTYKTTCYHRVWVLCFQTGMHTVRYGFPRVKSTPARPVPHTKILFLKGSKVPTTSE